MYLVMLNSLILNLSSKINFFKPVPNFPPVSLTPVSTTPTIQVTKFAAGVVDTAVANLSPVFLVPVVHLACEYFRKFSKKFGMTIKLFSRAWGKIVLEKT